MLTLVLACDEPGCQRTHIIGKGHDEHPCDFGDVEPDIAWSEYTDGKCAFWVETGVLSIDGWRVGDDWQTLRCPDHSSQYEPGRP